MGVVIVKPKLSKISLITKDATTSELDFGVKVDNLDDESLLELREQLIALIGRGVVINISAEQPTLEECARNANPLGLKILEGPIEGLDGEYWQHLVEIAKLRDWAELCGFKVDFPEGLENITFSLKDADPETALVYTESIEFLENEDTKPTWAMLHYEIMKGLQSIPAPVREGAIEGLTKTSEDGAKTIAVNWEDPIDLDILDKFLELQGYEFISLDHPQPAPDEKSQIKITTIGGQYITFPLSEFSKDETLRMSWAHFLGQVERQFDVLEMEAVNQSQEDNEGTESEQAEVEPEASEETETAEIETAADPFIGQ